DAVATAHPHHDRHGAHEHVEHEPDSFLVRERCPQKVTVPDAGMSARAIASWAETCGALLARSHARSTEGAIEKVRGSLAHDKEKRGKEAFLDEVGSFALETAEHVRHDHEQIAHEIAHENAHEI